MTGDICGEEESICSCPHTWRVGLGTPRFTWPQVQSTALYFSVHGSLSLYGMRGTSLTLSIPCLSLNPPYVPILNYLLPLFLYAFLHNVNHLCAKVLIYVNLCKCYQVVYSSCFSCLVCHFERNGKFWSSAVHIYHIFNDMPTACHSNKGGGQ